MKPFLTVVLGLAVLFVFFCTGHSAAQEPPRFEYVAPRPRAEFVSALTAIAIRQGDEIDVETVQRSGLFAVSGSESGLHDGATVLADDLKTVIFQPDQPFTPGETVLVIVGGGLKTRLGDPIEGISYQFTVSSRLELLGERRLSLRHVATKYPCSPFRRQWYRSGNRNTSLCPRTFQLSLSLCRHLPPRQVTCLSPTLPVPDCRQPRPT